LIQLQAKLLKYRYCADISTYSLLEHFGSNACSGFNGGPQEAGGTTCNWKVYFLTGPKFENLHCTRSRYEFTFCCHESIIAFLRFSGSRMQKRGVPALDPEFLSRGSE
jgi:hypothetical protein